VDSLEVVPSLFEEGDQEVEAHHDVDTEFIIGHVGASSAATHVGNFSKLELNGSTDVFDLDGERLLLTDHGGEHLDSVKNGSDNDGNSLKSGIGSDEKLELFGPLLDELLVLVELLEGIEIGDRDINIVVLNFLLVLLIGDNADLEVGSGKVGKSDGTDETLVLLGIVILKSELDFNRFSEFSGFVVASHFLDGFSNECVVNFSSHLYFVSNINDKQSYL
jgi:hypothetical protein